MSLIDIRDIHKVYKMGDTEVRALNGVSLRIEPGEFVAIMGASGSGKSTMLQILGLLDTPDSGSYQLLDREVSALKEDDLAAIRSQTLGFVFQQFNLLARTSALENVALPLLYSNPNISHGDPQKLLELVGLGNREHHKPNELSGGQQQRVAIARALTNQPKLILADEPTGNLDSKSSEDIIEFLGKMNASGITIILVTHEAEIATHARRIITMKDGKILSDEPNLKAGAVLDHSRSFDLKNTSISRSVFNFRQVGNYFHQAFKALMANKVRSTLSILGILIGVMAVIGVLALGAGAKQSMEKQLAALGTNLLIMWPESVKVGGVHQGTTTSRITLQDVDAISTVPRVKRVAPEIQQRAQITYKDKNWNTSVTGTTPNYADMRDSKPIYGNFFTANDVNTRNRVAILGLTVIKNLFGEKANPIGEWIKINRINFQVIGVLPVKGSNGWQDRDDTILVPVTTAMYRLFGQHFVYSVDIEAESSEATGPLTDSVKAFMKRLKHIPDTPDTEDAFQVRNLADIQATLSATTKIMTLLLSAIAAIALLVGGIGIMNIMLVSVTERTREIGLRKAIGARRFDILSQFLIESVAISLMGGALGITFGWMLAIGISTFAGWPTIVTINSIILASGFSALIGIIFGLWPAYKASRLSPILALRYE